jgi:ribosome-binding protein aMBF1 (putative translation factor)
MALIKKKTKHSAKEKEQWLKQLGATVKKNREKAALSQSALAYSIPMDSQNISRIERGIVNPSAYAVKQICDALDISISDFYNSFSKK